MNKIIAIDVPVWLKDVINKIKWDNLIWGMPAIIEQLVSNECRGLPQKQSDYSVENIYTTCPNAILETINLVDFARMNPQQQSDFRVKIESAVTTYLGVKL